MRIRGRKPSADCSVSPSPSPSSSTSSYSSSITAANSSSSSQDSSNSCSLSLLAAASHRCHGLDLLVKAIHQVTAGSIIGVPYIQRRVTIRRRRRSHGMEFDVFKFDEMPERGKKKAAKKKVNKKKIDDKKKRDPKKGKNVLELQTTIRDSVLLPWGRRSELAGEIGL